MSEQEVVHVMEQMSYGLHIIGSRKDGEPDGMMADWVMQVAFRPRFVAVSLENDARTLENIRANRFFTVNLLSQEEASMHLASKFAQPYYDAKVKGRVETLVAVHRKLEGIVFTTTASGCPVLADAMAWLECEAEEFIPVGDHTLVIGRVLDGHVVRDDVEPLTSTYTGWNYSG